MTPSSADIPTVAEPGGVIAGHRLGEELRRRGDGAAFRAEAPDGTPVTMYVLPNVAEERAAARFSARAEVLSRLSDPALPRILGFGVAPEGLWVASAAVQGVSLRSLLAEGVAPMRAVRLLGEVADALDGAHRAGLAHGDVRPENVIVQMRPVERALLVDFALAPEVLSEDEPEPAADVFALAAVLYECLAGTPPVEGTPRPLGSGLPPSLNAIIARGLASDPNARPSAAELMAEAARVFLEVPASAPTPTPTPASESGPLAPAPPWAEPPPEVRSEDAPPARARRRGVLGVLAAAVVVGGAGTAGYALSRESAPDEPSAPRTARVGVVSFTAPEGSELSRRPEERDRPSLAPSVAVRSSDPPGRISGGLASDRAAVLDPTLLAAEVKRRAPRPRVVRLGDLQGLRFEGLGPRGPSILYVAPTSAGTAVVACHGDRDSMASACANAARGLAVRGARGYDPTAGIAWKNRLATDMRRLRARRSAGLRRLRRASTPAGQARRAVQVARIYAAAARRLRRRAAPPQAARARRRVLTRLLAADRAYRSLSRAAGSANSPGYRRAAQRIRGADSRLRATLRAI